MLRFENQGLRFPSWQLLQSVVANDIHDTKQSVSRVSAVNYRVVPPELISLEFQILKGASRMDSYYNRKDLPRFSEIADSSPELGKKFLEYYASVFSEGELSEREKALIALAVAHTIQCPYCIDAYTQACLEKGSNIEEMTEALHVAVAIRGGASLVHGIQMRNIASEISM
jgi:alkylhydroperoxidase/carboxymuconolactone decarboxylase family protein